MRYFISLGNMTQSQQVKDENGNVLYSTKRNKQAAISLGSTFNVTLTKHGSDDVYTISKKGMNNKYTITHGANEIATIKEGFNPIGTSIKIDTSIGNFTIKGRPKKYKYTILRNGSVVSTISKKFVNMKGEFYFDSTESKDLDFLICISVVLSSMAYLHEQKMQEQRNASYDE